MIESVDLDSVNGSSVPVARRPDAPRVFARPRRRGWLIRRALLIADVGGLVIAFLLAEALVSDAPQRGRIEVAAEYLVFLGLLPLWAVAAKLAGLYDRDEERTDHSTADDVAGVFQLVTVCAWLLFSVASITGVAHPELKKVFLFWLVASALVSVGRVAARAYCHRKLAYLQNTVIVGAGEVGQLIARKFLQHREYGINLVGFVDESPLDRRDDLGHVAVIGGLDDLRDVVLTFDVDRVVIAFSNDSPHATVEVVHALSDLEVQVDVVPRLFELVNPNVTVHTVEGLPLVGLPPVKLARSSRWMKRAIDIVGASLLLSLTAPLFLVAAWRIKRESPGPVFFRQTRLGRDMREFTALKFRTMHVDAEDGAHRDFIRATMSSKALPQSNGIYKLDRSSKITPFGHWLRKTSLDELPQLINVVRGDMSLVGPRPCIPYETEFFESHHFQRFLVPQGLTGLWQVTARAHSTFGEALDMDVAYARGWSLGLDLRLLFRTPLQMVRSGGTA